MEIGKVSARLELIDVDVDLANSVGSVDEERDVFLIEEGLESLNGNNKGGD